jgi:16S rRNA (cytosine1402-N4)-methyltransferase
MLAIRPGGVYLDATMGGGGHSRAILDRLGSDGRLIALDQDEDALRQAAAWGSNYGARFRPVRGNFGDLDAALGEAGVGSLDGALFDLGVSSHQLDVAERGFSFRAEGPLDMRMDGREGLTAAAIVQTWSEADIADVLWKFGEERHSRRIARAIAQQRNDIQTTTDLAEVVRRAMPSQPGRDRIHPATRTFQAIRIAVNREMEMLSRGLDAAIERLSPGGRIVVISYHSLEDRIVKQLFRERSTGCICPPRLPICRCGHVATLKIITKKSVTPSEAEVAANPRARSARMRAAERLENA